MICALALPGHTYRCRSVTPALSAGIVAAVAGRYRTLRAEVGFAFADPVEADRGAAGVVVQPDALAEQDRCDVQVDLAGQARFEKLAADGR
jgi:hypothetical protein